MFKAAALRSLGSPLCAARARYSSAAAASAAASQRDLLLQSVQAPQIERINALLDQQAGVPGLVSHATLADVWATQTAYNLRNLKDVLKESEDKYLYCFSDKAAAAGAASATPSSASGFYSGVDASTGETTSTVSENKVVDQYYALLKTVSENFTDESYLFNSAASIYNLYYFLSSLRANPANAASVRTAHSSVLLDSPNAQFSNKPAQDVLVNLINKSFGSTTEFLTLLNDAAASIKGNCYTWLVLCHIENSAIYKNSAHLAILNTYNNGLPHNFASNRVKLGKEYSNKLKRANGELTTSASSAIATDDPKAPLSMEEAEFVDNIPFNHTPLLAIGSNPAFYLRDYGVYGKRAYIKNVLDAIDWSVVHSRIPQDHKS